MRNVVQLSKSNLRNAGIFIAVASVAAGGCSSTSERWNSATLGSGYESAAKPASAEGPINITPQARQAAERSPYYNGEQSQVGYQLASADAVKPAGHLQMARMDLPPLNVQAGPAPSGPRVRTADGYGIHNKGPLADGTYSGPRVYTPYDGPKDYSPPPYRGERDLPPPPRYDTPPPAAYRPEPEPRRYDEDRAPPRPRFYGEPRIYEPRRDAVPLAYEPAPKPQYTPLRRELPPVIVERPVGYYPVPNGKRPPTELEVTSPVDASTVKRTSDPVAADRGNGKVVTVAPGETLYTLAIRHGVTVDMIVKSNALDERRIKPGQELLIPASAAGPVSYANVDANRTKAGANPCDTQKCHVVKSGETPGGIAVQYGVPAHKILEANNLGKARDLKAGQTLVIPGTAPAKADEPKTNGFYGKAQSTAQAQPALPASAPVAPDVKTASASQTGEHGCEAALNNPLPRTGKTFRKPVEGLIIANFGPQRNGTVSEGVTISVPKGTPIKAAENGVVAYVGNELPELGNLILVRHADDYVTAYAHADAIDVKKCDIIKRGQVIGKAGTSGGASQPQLHFEIRKNSKPVDPAPLLAS